MSLSGSPKEKCNNSTCFELAEKLLTTPAAKCYVLILFSFPACCEMCRWAKEGKGMVGRGKEEEVGGGRGVT